MGKRRHNWKSRTVANVEIDNSTTKEIVVNIDHRADNYDSCNALVLPAKKRKTKNIDKKVTTTQFLSKKRRKQLEKVVDRKKKKLQRTTLLEELGKVQAPATELQQYESLISLQNKGLKKHFQELEAPSSKSKHKTDEEVKGDTKKRVLNSIKGSNKKRFAILRDAKQDKPVYGPNVLGFESSGSSDESDTNDENENETSVPDSTVTTEIAKDEEMKDENNRAKDVKNKTTDRLQGDEDIKNKTTDRLQGDEDIKNKTTERLGNETTDRFQEDKGSTEKVQQSNVVPQVRTPAVFVSLNRKPEIQAARLKLPIIGEEQIIIEKINENPIVIITGETGSGKTTQVPQFLYEAGYAREKLIGITEPRRVAAMSVSRRVAEEMNLTEREISYLIRFEGNVTKDTKIKFMTDGILLREFQYDNLLKKYSVIILDEAHERSVNTDVLIGLLSMIIPRRNKDNDPLKLIIMSATLHVEEFVENKRLFKVKPPVITIEARQFPVTTYFNRRTSEDYVKDALYKAMKIHNRLPEGGILIFVTGQQEVHTIVNKLRKAFPSRKNEHHRHKLFSGKRKTRMKEVTDEEYSGQDDSDDDFTKEALRRYVSLKKRKKEIKLPRINLDNYSVCDTYEDSIDRQDDDEDILDEDEDEDEDIINFVGLRNAQPMWVLPLYSLLPSHEQAKVFKPPPDGHRLCVVSTNVAETSLTIPNVKYVVDSGRCKNKVYDQVTGVSIHRISYISKAAASQRAGRAGRTGPGYCYRLYSSAVYSQFVEYGQPEIQQKLLDNLVLQLKAMNIKKIENFPFPTPPNITQVKSAEKRLTILGALEESRKTLKETCCAKVTPLGRSIAAFSVAPRYGKMLAFSNHYNLMAYTICMVAALSVQELLMEEIGTDDPNKNKWLQIRRSWLGNGNSFLLGDPMILLKAVEGAEYAESMGEFSSFCKRNGLRHKAMVEIRKLRQQLTNEINLIVADLNLTIDPKLPPPTEKQTKFLRHLILASMGDQVAKKLSPDEINKKEDRNNAKWKYAYRSPEMEEPVFMHSSCILRVLNPEWIVYQELYETNKVYMRGVTVIEPKWLPTFAPALCNLSEPMTDPPPSYNPKTGKIMCRVSGTFGRAGWQLPQMDIEYPSTVDGVKLFARFFLEGQVCPKLKKFVPSLLTTPGSITKSWAKLVPRIQVITQPLLSRAIMSKNKLLEAWASDKQFLLSAYQDWLPKSVHTEVALLWPPM